MVALRQTELPRSRIFLLALVAYLLAATMATAGDRLTASLTGGDVSFSRHVAPLLWKHCAGCHRPGEVGPFSLLHYADAAKRADFLVQVTAARRMPPWKPEPGFGKFHDERRLSDDELAVLRRWVEQGAPEGDPAELPKPPSFTEGWQLGKPDIVLTMKEPFAIPAGGSDIYRCFVIPIGNDVDKMVSAVEFRPGNRKVVHHAIMFLDANGQGRKKDGSDGTQGFASFGGPGIIPTGGLGSWVPGHMPRHMPDGIVRYIKKGSDLVLQLHYHPSGKEETDQSTLGLYFSKKPVKKIVTGIAIVQPEMVIPPEASRHEITAQTDVLPVDVSVLGISPHMHNLGREFKVTATRPSGGDDVPLIWIKDWDFNWQGAYEFARPVRLPKGSIIKVSAIYDNSSENPKNPNNPPREVKWGEQTSDEMCLCGIQVFTETMADLRKIATMRGNEMGAGLEGGMPGLSTLAKKKEAFERKMAAGRGKVASSEGDNRTAKTSEKERAIENFEVPAGGIPIPESYKQLLAPYNSDGNELLSREELERMPPLLQKLLKEGLVKKAGK